MTTIYDPRSAVYLDEADLRGELTRVFDVCNGCRRCVELCPSFPTLFEMLDRVADHDAGRLTPAQQDAVVDECFQCKRCVVNCPYAPDRHALGIDVPRLMLRATAVQYSGDHVSIRSRLTTHVTSRTDLVGKLATTSRLGNHIANAPPRSMLRRFVSIVFGVSSTRTLPTFTGQRFSVWFKRRPRITLRRRQGRVVVVPTCIVEYQAPAIGKDLVKVYERNAVQCSVSGVRCCGAPWLYAGDVDRFTKVAEKNVATLAKEAAPDVAIVVAQPACAHVIKLDYPDYVRPERRADAELVAERTWDAVEYLMDIHHRDDTVLDTDFDGPTPRSIAYHATSHLRVRGVGFKGRDLLKLLGARVRVVRLGSGMDGMWGIRKENQDRSAKLIEELAVALGQSGDELVGDCHLSNRAVARQTDQPVVHPLQVVARAYGIADEH